MKIKYRPIYLSKFRAILNVLKKIIIIKLQN